MGARPTRKRKGPPWIFPRSAARAYLLRVAEPPAPALSAFIAERGPVEAARLIWGGVIPDAVYAEVAGRRTQDADNAVDADFATAAQMGARLVIPEDEEWPARFASLDSSMVPPIALWVRGPHPLGSTLDRSITVVGARAATGYGEHVSAEFGYGLVAKGVTVASGTGYGIDEAALRGALSNDGMAVAFLANGIAIDYPAGNASLLARVADSGVLVSEYPPGTPPARNRFLRCGALLGAATRGTVLVEAGVRSSARRIAEQAHSLGLSAMAVPGPITSAASIGCHALIRAGIATPVTSVEEVLESAWIADE